MLTCEQYLLQRRFDILKDHHGVCSCAQEALNGQVRSRGYQRRKGICQCCYLCDTPFNLLSCACTLYDQIGEYD
jgi:hypothetical protein